VGGCGGGRGGTTEISIPDSYAAEFLKSLLVSFSRKIRVIFTIVLPRIAHDLNNSPQKSPDLTQFFSKNFMNLKNMVFECIFRFLTVSLQEKLCEIWWFLW
jgi:hypothetical protein